jgi:hypothetical protein
MNAETFLRTLWGDVPPGLIQIWIRNGKRSQYARSPLGAAAHASAGRPDVYTGVALAHKDHGHSRRARSEQAIALAGLWLDIDVNGGPDRKTGAAPSKLEARKLAGALLEPTLVVDSGYGVHAWWLFDTPWRFVTLAEQQAGGLASAQWYALHRTQANKHGWTLDHTHDLARLLRIPGTTNAKDPGRPRTVTVLAHGGRRYSREELLARAGEAGAVALTAAARTGPVQFILRTNAELEQQVLDALELNAPDFYETLTHQRPGTEAWSMSEWDLSIATQAAQAGWTDQRIADVLVWHRLQHDPTDPKAERIDYLRRTIGTARARSRRDAAKDTLHQLAGRAA